MRSGAFWSSIPADTLSASESEAPAVQGLFCCSNDPRGRKTPMPKRGGEQPDLSPAGCPADQADEGRTLPLPTVAKESA